ncbi:MAG: sigma-70 family RNA polymerase sigma factor [Actinomycetota bacterium]
MTEEAVAEARRVETFEDFFHANYERLLRAMYLATGNRHEAEDLAQDAMARVLERWDQVRELDDPVGYVFRVALNRRRSLLRRLAVAIRRTPAPEPSSATEPTSAVDDRDTIRRALRQLPGTQREALVLCDWLGMTDAEAGRVLNASPGAVRTRLYRARVGMRIELEGQDE